MEKVFAYRYSNEVAGTEMKLQEVEIVDRKVEDRTATYIVKTADGIYCTAIYNPFSGAYYADDVYGIVEKSAIRKTDMEM